MDSENPVRRLAESFDYCPRCGGAGPARSGGRLACGGCGHEFYVNPSIAVGIILLDESDQGLFLRRAHDPGKGRLGVPGGFVDAGETAENALRREVSEEVGLILGTMQFLASFPNIYDFRGVRYDVLDLFFVGRVPGFEEAEAREEVAELVIRPVRALDLDEIAFPSMRRAVERLREGPGVSD